MRILDLYCGAGGASAGYAQAGFQVTGVDLAPQPHYPFEFVQADAIAYMGAARISDFDAIHASPPCQAYSVLARRWPARNYPDLIGPTRELLQQTGLPWIIENVPGAPLAATVMLCGSAFGLASGARFLRRHRYFELSFPLSSLVPGCDHRGRQALGVYGHGRWDNNSTAGGERGGYQGTKAEKAAAMGIDWMIGEELVEAIPPAYTAWLGTELLRACELNFQGPAATLSS